MSAKDKQKLAIAVGLVVVVAVALYFLVLRKPAPEAELAPPPIAARPVAPRPAPIAAAQVLAAAQAAKPLELSRPDPFEPLIKQIEPIWPVGQRPPVAAEEVGIGPVVANLLPLDIPGVRESRRMAGVLWNEHVWAIIETERTTAVVQPGDVVEGNTIRAISPQGMILTTKRGMIDEVKLQGRIPAAVAAVPVSAPAGRPALPGMGVPQVAAPPSRGGGGRGME
ncbi:MAG TPA: hypothetical protein VM221_10420 [Armatimonadota bacterium]|nr:hypothetical protein [Armatimonadota bacterium]